MDIMKIPCIDYLAVFFHFNNKSIVIFWHEYLTWQYFEDLIPLFARYANVAGTVMIKRHVYAVM